MGSQYEMNPLLVVSCLVGAAVAVPYPSPFPFPDGPVGRPSGPPEGPLSFPRPGKDGNYAAGDYFQYINVPAHKVYEWGYRRGAPTHNREQYLSLKDHTFKSKLKWHDQYGGHGEHYYDYNHAGKPEPAYKPEPVYAPKPSYSASL